MSDMSDDFYEHWVLGETEYWLNIGSGNGLVPWGIASISLSNIEPYLIVMP